MKDVVIVNIPNIVPRTRILLPKMLAKPSIAPSVVLTPEIPTTIMANNRYTNIGIIEPMIIAFFRYFLLFFNSSFISGIAGVARNAKKTTPYGMNRFFALNPVRLFVSI